MVEQRTENPCVGGSIPSLATILSALPFFKVVSKKIAALGLCAALFVAHPARALSAADQEERAFVFHHALVASLRAARGEGEAAAHMFDEIARHLNDPEFSRAAVDAAETAGNFALAAQYAATWRELGGGTEAQMRAASAVVQSGNLPDAEPLLRELIESDSIPAEILHEILAAAEDRAAALTMARRLFADDSDSQYHFGRLAARAGNLDDARAAFARAAASADIPDPHFALALVAHNQDGPAAAVAKVDDYVKNGCPGADPERCHEFYALFAYNEFSRGESEWRSALKKGFASADFESQARLTAGELLESGEMPTRAVSHYAEVGSGPHYFRARLGMARVARDNGDNTLALEILDATPTGGQKEFSTRETTAADIIRRRDGPEAAMQRIMAARKISPVDPNMIYSQSLYAEQAGRLDMALELLETMTALFPDDPDGWNALGYVMADHGVNLREAREHITRALRMKPDDPNFLDSLGWVHYRLGNLGLARRHLEEAAKKSDAAEIAAHLGEVLWELGEREAAREVWRRALERQEESNPVLDETLARYRPF